MDNLQNYIDVNRRLWDEKTKHHVASSFYNVDDFLKGASSLNDIELPLLGDIKNKTILHLQCHFGMDSLSLARMGADVTGVDFSEEAIKKAVQLNQELGLNAQFVCSDIYELPKHLEGRYDIVYTSYGVLGWLPDMKKWASIVARYLKPGGAFILVEFHPVVWMFNNEFNSVQYSYFNKEAIVETINGTYADKTADIKMLEIGWNHDIAEVLQNLVDAGLKLKTFREFDFSPHNCFMNTVEINPHRFQIKGLEGKIPMVYALKAMK